MPDDTQSLDERKNTLLAEFIFDEKGIFVLLDLTIMRHRDCFGRHWLQAVLRRFLVSFHPYPRRSKNGSWA